MSRGDWVASVTEALRTRRAEAARARDSHRCSRRTTDHIAAFFGPELGGALRAISGRAFAKGRLCSWLPRTRQTLACNTRKMSKRIAGRRYSDPRLLRVTTPRYSGGHSELESLKSEI